MTTLVVVPDYASHYLPLSTVGTALRESGEQVVVATGPGLRPRVEADGFGWECVVLGRGSNDGTARPDTQRADEAASLRQFFAASAEGMAAVLTHQARERLTDLLWEPDRVVRELDGVVRRVRPDRVVADHISFNATLALRVLGVPFTSFVPGHPSQLPVAGEVYGYPVAWPACLQPDPDSMGDLHRLCTEVSERFTSAGNEVLERLAPGAPLLVDAFGAHGDSVLFNHPAPLVDPARVARLPGPHVFLGSCVRRETLSPSLAGLDAPGPPVVYASLGTFLSARADVLRTVAQGLASLPVRAVVATGSTPPGELGPLPPSVHCEPFVPQVAVVERSTVVVTHGGANSVTESLTAGVPLVVLPLSTDQFAMAADVERAGLGVALDPNRISAPQVADAVSELIDGPAAGRAAALGDALRRQPGARRAADHLLGGRQPS